MTDAKDKIPVQRDRFEAWYYEQENHSLRAERMAMSYAEAKAAFDAGWNAAQPAEAQQEPVKPTLPPWWFEFIVAVCELPDRNSPEGEPDAMVATEDELASCALAAIERTPPDECVAALKSRLQAIGDLAASCRTGPGLREAMKEIECIAAAQPAPAAVPLTDEQRNDCIEAWSSQGWGDRLGEVVRICIAIERAHGIAAAGDKP